VSSLHSLYLKTSISYLTDEQSAYGDLHLLRLIRNLMHLHAVSAVSNLAVPPSYLGREYLL
jgi:hypothetical protein